MRYLHNSRNMKPKYADGGWLKDLLTKEVKRDSSNTNPDGTPKLTGLNKIVNGLGGINEEGVPTSKLANMNPTGIIASIIADTISTHKNTDNAIKANNQQARTSLEFQTESDKLNDASLLSSFPTNGVNSVTRYARGGELLPVNDKVELAVGDSHEKDTNNDGSPGISLSLQGNDVAEIEGGEVKWDNKIFSDRIGIGNRSFANIALELTKTTAYKNAEEMEDKYKETANDVRSNIFKRGTARRMIDKNPNPLGVLFQIQETQKAQQAEIEQQNADVPKAAMGMDLAKLLGKAGNVSADIVPYLDNIYNAKLTANAPQLPTPTRRVAPTLKTSFDINPQLNEINRDTQALNDIITDTTASSSIANTNRIANRLQGSYAKNRVLSEKQNAETGLINQQSGINADITNANAGILDEYRMREFGRQSDLRAERSANVANAVEDARMAKIDSNAAKLDKQKIALTAAQYLDTGVLDRSGFDKVMGIIDNGGSLEEALAFMNNQRKRVGLTVPESISTVPKTINSLGKNFRGRNRVEEIMEGLVTRSNREPERKLTVLEQLMENGFK